MQMLPTTAIRRGPRRPAASRPRRCRCSTGRAAAARPENMSDRGCERGQAPARAALATCASQGGARPADVRGMRCSGCLLRTRTGPDRLPAAPHRSTRSTPQQPQQGSTHLIGSGHISIASPPAVHMPAANACETPRLGARVPPSAWCAAPSSGAASCCCASCGTTLAQRSGKPITMRAADRMQPAISHSCSTLRC